MTDNIECIVVGAGVVGLATAARLAASGIEVIVVEAQSSIGSQISSRNSEVVHAGIYYPKGSLKASLCVAGRQMLYRYCVDRGVPHRRCGKLIVATSDDQTSLLEGLYRRALGNGVEDLHLVDRQTALQLEPALDCRAALLSPGTGIVDSHALMLALQGDLASGGGAVALNTPAAGIGRRTGGFELRYGGDESGVLHTRLLVNAAGLGANRLAANIETLSADKVPALRYARGNYFRLAGPAPFKRLVYPLPEAGGLGVHITLDLAGQARFGPDVEWLDTVDYTVDAGRSAGFYPAIRKYWPGLPDESLVPDYAGIRPKIFINDAPYSDFMISTEQHHGVPGLVNLFGIESPGLTSCLAIAERVAGALHRDRSG